MGIKCFQRYVKSNKREWVGVPTIYTQHGKHHTDSDKVEVHDEQFEVALLGSIWTVSHHWWSTLSLSFSYLPRHYQATKNLYDTGNRLQAWRGAILSPIYENGCKHDPQNYRPVSITSIACKILEHNLSSAMMPHLDTCGILTGEQHGVRKGLSTETQLADVHHWSHILHKGSRTDALFIDFSKALEPVPQSRLPDKLRYYGIADKTNKDIKGLLYNRRPCVVVNGSSSHWTPVPSGIPTE